MQRVYSSYLNFDTPVSTANNTNANTQNNSGDNHHAREESVSVYASGRGDGNAGQRQYHYRRTSSGGVAQSMVHGDPVVGGNSVSGQTYANGGGIGGLGGAGTQGGRGGLSAGTSSPYMMDHTSPRASIISHANSAYSNADSTRHILSGSGSYTQNPHHSLSAMADDFGGPLMPPSAPFAAGGSTNNRGGDNLSLLSAAGSGSNLSLSVNYVPSKFSSSIVSPSGTTRKRKGGKGMAGDDDDGPVMPKRGGGVDAFKYGESRVGARGKARLRWNKFKWMLFATNTLMFFYSFAALVVCLLVWFDVWTHADILRVGNRTELVLSTIAASIGLLTSLIGYAGILLNNRSFLAWYTFLTWITFAFLVVPGYVTYRKRTFNLEGKLNLQWSKKLGATGRMRVQNQLSCCGYFSPFVEATISQTCYARSILEGCKGPYLKFERDVLKRWYAAAFILVPFQLAAIVAGLLCSNHVTHRFGKGMMPEAYRLNMNTMAAIMESYANQIAEEYGQEVADEIRKRAQAGIVNDSTMSLASPMTPGMTNVNQTHAPLAPYHAKYGSLGGGGTGGGDQGTVKMGKDGLPDHQF